VEAMKADNASFQNLMIDGGMVINDWFCQKLSNVLEVKVKRPEIIETTSLGAAFLAGLSSGIFEDFESLNKSKKIEKTFVAKEEGHRYLEWKEAVKKVLT
jgi:glycerol kinase